MGRGKIECETKSEKKKNFHLGGNARRRKQSVSAFEKIDKEERAKGCCLQEDSQEERAKCCRL